MEASMAQHTPLHATHVAAGARMVDFAGWDMPVNYGSQIEEHHAVRRVAGMFDVSHMLALDLEGADAQAFLRGLVANDVAKLVEPGKALYSCMLNVDGGVIDDLIIYFFSPTRYRVVVNAGTADKDVAWMRARIATTGAQVSLTARRDLAMIAVQGPEARAKVWAALPGSEAVSAGLKPFQAAYQSGPSGDRLIALTGYTGEDGAEIFVPWDNTDELWNLFLEMVPAAKPIGLGARDTLRTEMKYPLYGQDINDRSNPFEAGLGYCVKLEKPNFIGRTALLRQKETGLKRKRVIFTLRNWGILAETDQRYVYRPLRRTLDTAFPALEEWMLAAVLTAHPAEELPFDDLVRLPELFPFRFTIGVDQIRKSARFEVHRQ
ncbi:MAG: glycine cleavage system aminomethyltransferase GcvT, partial [Zoogloea sp.]|nr:glycine cleavage system aminomethyltransferase GcvT [Zoogloea sp.]